MTSTASKRIWFITLLCLITLTALGEQRLKDVDVTVVIADNGDAHFTEVRRMSVDSKGTEYFITLKTLDGREIQSLKVTDERGMVFQNVKSWDIKASRAEKTHKCGIIKKGDGAEICWGLGETGERTFTVEYTLTSLLRSYKDKDGFFHEFITYHKNAATDHAKVTIIRENGIFKKDSTQIWAFKYDGRFDFIDGKLVAETSDKKDMEESMRLLVATEKGVFHPTVSENKTFNEMKKEALKGSDYKGMGFWGWVLLILFFFVPLFFYGLHIYRVWRSKRKAKKDLLWYRDIPYKGNLLRANCILNAHRYRKANYDNLISASVLRLISVGALRIENHYVEPTGLSKMMNRQGEVKPCIVVYELPQVDGLVNFPMLTLLYNIFHDAAGNDRILQPKELKKFMKNNPTRVEEMMKVAMQKMSIKDVNNDMENVRKVYGLQQFLKDFTLANERHVQELSLWKEYLVWAELFGIAKQVREDMKKINPEYLKFDDFYRAMLNDNVVRDVTGAAIVGTSATMRSSRSSGGGGASSRSGGSGHFSGGGGEGFR